MFADSAVNMYKRVYNSQRTEVPLIAACGQPPQTQQVIGCLW